MAACAERAGEQKELKTLCVVYKERDEIQFCGQSRWIPTYGQGRGRCVMHRALHVNDKKYGEYRPGDNCCAETTRPRLQLALTAPKAKVTAWHLSHLKSTLCASEKEKRVAVVHTIAGVPKCTGSMGDTARGPAQLARPRGRAACCCKCTVTANHTSLSSPCTRTPARKFAHFGSWHTPHACRPHARLQYITCLHRAPAAPRGSRLKKFAAAAPAAAAAVISYNSHLGAIRNGLAFSRASLFCIKPHGGHGWVATVVRSCGVAGSSRLNRWRAIVGRCGADELRARAVRCRRRIDGHPMMSLWLHDVH